MILKKDIAKNRTTDYSEQIKKVKTDCAKLLAINIKGPKKLKALKSRLAKHSQSLWVFLDHHQVPPDNNGAEKAIRKVKVKQKVSGQFRSVKGAEHFVVI